MPMENASPSTGMESGGPSQAGGSADPEFTILVDGLCPMCAREANYMLRLDRGRGKLRVVDIAAPGFDARQYGRTQDEVMGSIHGVLADGRVISGVEVFRRAYGAVGRSWMLGWTAWPGFRSLADALYTVFARYRIPVSNTLVKLGLSQVPLVECGDRCTVPRRSPSLTSPTPPVAKAS